MIAGLEVLKTMSIAQWDRDLPMRRATRPRGAKLVEAKMATAIKLLARHRNAGGTAYLVVGSDGNVLGAVLSAYWGKKKE